ARHPPPRLPRPAGPARHAPGEFVVAKLLAATVIRVDRVADERDDRVAMPRHGLPFPGAQAVQKSMDSAGRLRFTATRSCPPAHEIATCLATVAAEPGSTRTAPEAPRRECPCRRTVIDHW